MESEAAQQREGCAAHHEVLLHTGMKYFRPNTCRPTALLFPIFLQHCFIVAVVQSLSHVQLFAAPWTAACQASLSFTISWSLFILISIELMMPSNHLILCHHLLLPSILPSIGVFSNESVLHIRWPKYLSFSFSISPSSEYSELISLGLTGLISLQPKGLSRVFSNTAV